jgi:hypothetical protein
LFVCLFWMFSNKLDLNQETHFTILSEGRNGVKTGQIWTNLKINSEKNFIQQVSVLQNFFFTATNSSTK